MNATKILELLKDNDLKELERLCRFEIETAKYPFLKAAKARERLAQKVAKEKGKDISILAGAYIIENTQQICNGSAAGVYSDIIDGLIIPPVGAKSPDMRRLLTPQKDRKNYPVAIDLQDLKARSKLAAADGVALKKQFVKIGKNFYSAELLFDFLPTLTGELRYWQGNESGRISPFGAVGDNGEIMILPARVPDESEVKVLKIY